MLRVNVQNTILQAGAHSPLKEGRYVKTSISNTGSQISQENLKRLFQEGFTTKAGGKGVGLAVSAQIIKEHGGCIEARSEKDVGTTFDVYLPAVA